jgi:manganese transport protein
MPEIAFGGAGNLLYIFSAAQSIVRSTCARTSEEAGGGYRMGSIVKPHSLLRSFAAIGPGIVVAGSVIGSGELINTPLQAAQFGFVLLWVVLLSCVIKYFLQVEIGRYCLSKNCTTIEALNEIPGPKFRGTSWPVIVYMIGYCFAVLTIVGIIGALGGLMHSVWPLPTSDITSIRIWATLNVIVAIGLLWQGWYGQLEMLVMVLVGAFSISAGVAVFLVQGTPYHISGDEIMSGLSFSLGDDRKAAAYAVISLMGALGVSANELMMYPYWILEKGYAREVGDPSSPGWADRARRWIRTIWIDAGLTTILSTVVTAAFFLLGTAILHRQKTMPQGLQVVDQISDVFTASYGPWSKALFVVGAFCTLYSTLVVVAAATGRMMADFLASLDLLDRANESSARRCHRIVQTAALLILLSIFLVTTVSPAGPIMFGHFILGVFLTPLLMLCIGWLAFRTDRRVRMSWPAAVALVGSIVIILACVAVNVFVQVTAEVAPHKPAVSSNGASR